ncbi:DUF6932 family protein [Novosphingobium subterraneum]|uniref:DUF6932 family protein n=1 Tax=Novosphingobium subterraneum TaxID=48936 RepID=UPI003CFD3E34
MLTISEFDDRYGFTDRRRYLIAQLKADLDSIVAKGWLFRAVVYGSLVNSNKLEPGDIDVLLCISGMIEPQRWHQITDIAEIHIIACQLPIVCGSEVTARSLQSCHGLNKLVELFNEGVKKTNENIEISPEQCVEVTL